MRAHCYTYLEPSLHDVSSCPTTVVNQYVIAKCHAAAAAEPTKHASVAQMIFV